MSKPPGGDMAPDYVGHFFEYGVFSLTILWGLTGGMKRPLDFQMALGAFTISIVFGILDEFHQAFVPERHSSISDAMVDMIGAFVFISIACFLFPRIRRVLRG